MSLDPPPDLPYYIRRSRYHMPQLYLERRRDQLNPKTMLYEYVEMVKLRGVYGDVFVSTPFPEKPTPQRTPFQACERDLKQFLETKLGQPVATQADEIQGRIRVRGADRSLVEQFVYEAGF